MTQDMGSSKLSSSRDPVRELSVSDRLLTPNRSLQGRDISHRSLGRKCPELASGTRREGTSFISFSQDFVTLFRVERVNPACAISSSRYQVKP